MGRLLIFWTSIADPDQTALKEQFGLGLQCLLRLDVRICTGKQIKILSKR